MQLSVFLNYFDFDYEVVNGQIRLVDLQGAYLGDIGEDRFELSKSGLASVVDRLEVYINDYIIEDLEEHLLAEGVDFGGGMDLGEMAKIAREKDIFCDFDIIEAILNPSSLELEKEKIIESFSVGQMYYENDTKKYIVLENICKDTKDIWNFGVYDKDMTYLYDTTIMDARLALDIINGDIKSVTSEKLLRLEPNSLLGWKGELSATLEDNEKLWERFNDCQDADGGELRYVTVDYNPKDDSMTFKLHFERFAENDLDVVRSILEISAEPDEKALLLKEMRALKPAFFKRLEKPALHEAISAAEEQKGFCTPGFNFKIDKEEGIDR